MVSTIKNILTILIAQQLNTIDKFLKSHKKNNRVLNKLNSCIVIIITRFGLYYKYSYFVQTIKYLQNN